ncbi:MAG: Eco57I restriction-modification methylase domain-containing protein, partial [Rhizobiales bacterium]|nr:Eco57I restriction-modification methylase domain-containing protein [Hyphomicrobiales bacterium]
SGVFLVTAFDYLKSEYDKVNAKMAELRGSPDLFDPDAEILSQNLYGVDVNAESVEITKLSLWLKTAKKGKELASLDHTIRVGDSLIEDSNFAYLEHGFTWQKAFPEVFANGGFDVVLGNPPYVRQELLSPLKPYLQKRFEVYHGVADLYCYFFERGVRLLKPGGRLGYISSSTFFKTNSGKPLRTYLPKAVTLETITDFGDLQVFEGVTTYPAILTMQRREAPKDHTLRFWKLDEIPREDFSKSFDDHAQYFPQSALTETSWQLENPALRALRNKIVDGKQTLKQVYGSPYRGVLTGRNEAFVIDRATRDRLVAEDPKSIDILKPWLEDKDLKRWHAEPRDIFIIFTRRGIDIDQYPAIKNYLEQDRQQLEPKPANWKPEKSGDKWPGRKPGNYKWYELQDTIDYHEEFDKPKIVYPHFNNAPNFHLEKIGSYSNDKSYIIPEGGFELLALLNSEPLWKIMKGMSPPVRGGFHELRIQYVETIPIPSASDTDKAELARLAEACQSAAEARYEKQQAFRHRIPDLCPLGRDPKLNTKLKNWWKLDDFAAFRATAINLFRADIPLAERTEWENWFTRKKAEIASLSAEISRFEADINKIVYRLFELTPEEISLLEANI